MILFWTASVLSLLAAAALVARPLLAAGRVLPAGLSGLALAVLAAGLFVASGGPPTRGAPFETRLQDLLAMPPDAYTAEERLAVLTEVTARNPDDPQGWRFLGQELARAGRYFEAAGAFRRSATLAPHADVYRDLAAVIIALNEGMITLAAEAAYEEVLKHEPGDPEARWQLALVRFQQGDRGGAAREWGALALEIDADDPRREAIAGAAVDRLATPQAGPGGAGAAPFADLANADPEAMITGMVERLALRVEAEPGDLAGWLALARARAILEDVSGARAALAEARETFADDAGAVLLLAVAEDRFGLGGEAVAVE